MSTLSMSIVTYLIEYLGEFEFIFETILDYESEDQMGSFDAKKPPSKISFLGTFKNSGDNYDLDPIFVVTKFIFESTPCIL
jgi:hypothetical protein